MASVECASMVFLKCAAQGYYQELVRCMVFIENVRFVVI